jgi:DNA polymerase I-like protein with 3'-5' exonuclease and polymerase domains
MQPRKTVAIIDKAPSRNDYSKYFDFPFEVFHMSSVPVTKLLKKNVDLDFEPDFYDLIICVGSEAAKEYAKVTSVTSMAGHVVNDKYICISNPSILIFKPEGKQDFERSVARVKDFYENSNTGFVDGDYRGIRTEAEALAYLEEVWYSEAPFVAMDTEASSLYVRNGYVLGISMTHRAKQGVYIDYMCITEAVENKIQTIIDKYRIIFHNMKFDRKMIEFHYSMRFRLDRVEDTMVMHYVLDEINPHGLKVLALKYTDFGDYDSELEVFKKDYCYRFGITLDEFSYEFIPFDIMYKYAAIDTAVTWTLAFKWLPLIHGNPNFKKVYYDIMLRGTWFLGDMEEVGIPLSVERLEASDAYLAYEIEETRKKIYEFPEILKFEEDNGIAFNPNSVNQLRTILFTYLGLNPTGKKTGTGANSTDAEVLKELSELHPLPALLLKVRQLNKMRSTYLSKIIPEIDSDTRIRTNFNLIFTTSGRLSSSGKFNAQQIPRDDPLIKGCIVAPEGYKIVCQDLQTGEVYYAAVLSGDKALQSVFLTGGDFHSTIAHMVFNLPCKVEDVKKLFPSMRQSAKAITFGILYGSGPAKVAETVTKATGEYYSIEQATEDISAYFKKFHVLKKWLKKQEEIIRSQGYVYSFFGRKRRLVNVFSPDKGIAAHEVRSGINSLIQSVCSDMNLFGAMDTADMIKAAGLDAHIFMLVHDSIVAIVKDEDVDAYCKILQECTQADRGCNIPGKPIGVDQSVTQDYSEGKWDKFYELKGGVLSRISAKEE